MNDLFSVITGIIMHAYLLVIGTCLLLVPARELFNAFIGRRPI